MALQTDLNIFPYYDDYDPTKNYYRVLFKPGVAVQARELNQLQAILQNQIEKFGDNIFKRGTIIEGCNISTHPNVPYVKIKDLETDGTPINISTYKSKFVRNAANVTAHIEATEAGFESRSPDLNTLFVRYNGSGTDYETSTFSADDTLQIYNPTFPIEKVKIIQGSRHVSNTDEVVIMSAIAVQNTTGGTTFSPAFATGHVIQNGVANATIISVDTTTNTEVVILQVKPLASDLISANTLLWKFSTNDSIVDYNTSQQAKIVETIGAGAEGSITTDSLGKITAITMTAGGSGYYIQPHVTVRKLSTGSLIDSDITEIDTEAQNFMSTITVANTATVPIGTGYGLGVGEGVIYQKGFFSRVEPQFVIVEKYSNTGFDKTVGFNTAEDIVDSNQDQTLLDNATGTYNYAAPGADRLHLSPYLEVLTKDAADANTEFLPIVEFSAGKPYRKNLNTVYNVIGDEMAKRTYEESGNYVLNKFNVAVKDTDTFLDTATSINVIVDPGTAYINGYRVSTDLPFSQNIDKGIDTAVSTLNTGVNYGNYTYVKDLVGNFDFNKSALVKLYDANTSYISSNKSDQAIAPSGGATQIGTARVRSVVLESGEPGTAAALYKMYLFDIVMNTGKNFSSTKSIYYDGTVKGIADVVPGAGGFAVLNDADKSTMLSYVAKAVSSVNNITYTYRTTDTAATAYSNGVINVSLGTSGEVFPAIFNSDLLVTPRSSYQAATEDGGTISITSGQTTVSGVGSSFTSNFKAGDFVKIANTGSQVIAQVASVANNTHLYLNTAAGSSVTGGSIRIYYPAGVPISLTNHPTNRTAATTTTTNLQIYLGDGIRDTSGNPVTANMSVTYNVNKTVTNPQSKVINRNVYTRIITVSNDGGIVGPWALGVSDAFRLRKVYKANTASRALSFNALTDVNGTTDFISVANNPFSNGDSVVYSNTGGTTSVGGLTNSTTYYAVYANSSGMALSTSRGGSNVNITAAGTSENHTLTGQPIYFTGDTYGVTDVTNDFWIDTNQKEDYLDISYLAKKPRTTNLSTNDGLLVVYDAFYGGDIGIKAVSSYAIDDTVAFADLDETSIHTLELPEVLGKYDLRDHYDFRPRSANTISYDAAINDTSIVNPGEPTDANRFTATEMYIPAPRSTVTANVEYYQGRIDKVLVTAKNGIIIRRGNPSSNPVEPTESTGSIALQVLNIPPYPSIPATALSGDMAKIADTKVINEVAGDRINKFRISFGLNKNQIASIQPKNYKMTDIAKLENRLNALEYYVSFTLAEAMANARFIPSSLDALTDRFRFGFFVDPFTDYNYADTNNPEFYSNIVGDQLVPKMKEFNLEFETETQEIGMITLPYNEYTLISQTDASEGFIEGDVEVTTVSQQTSTIIQRNRTTSRNDNGTVYEEFFYTFSSLQGPAEFYICGRDNWLATEISQGTTAEGPWTTVVTSAGASQVTNSDISIKGLTGLESGWENRNGVTLDRKGSGPTGLGGWIEDCFKLLWTHNPNAGIYYKIRVYKGGHHGGLFGGQGKKGSFAYKLFYPSDVIQKTTKRVINPASFVYTGIVHNVTPSEFALQFSMPYIDYFGLGGGYYVDYNNLSFISDAQKFNISVTGLKPNTLHNFIFDGSDKTAKCSQIRTSTTNTTGLLSDNNGIINFDFYFDAGIDEATSDMEQANKLMAAAAGVKAFSIESTDGSSKSSGTIGIKYYSTLNTFTTELNTTPTATQVATQTVAPAVVTPTLTQEEINDAISKANIGIMGGFNFNFNLNIP